MQFLKENWLWVAVPFFAILTIVAIVLFVSGGGEGENPFVYSIW